MTVGKREAHANNRCGDPCVRRGMLDVSRLLMRNLTNIASYCYSTNINGLRVEML